MALRCRTTPDQCVRFSATGCDCESVAVSRSVTDHLFVEPPLSQNDPLQIFCAYEGHGYPLPCHQAADDHRFKAQSELDAYFEQFRAIRVGSGVTL